MGRPGRLNQVFITSMEGATSSCLFDDTVASISAFPLSATVADAGQGRLRLLAEVHPLDEVVNSLVVARRV